MTAHIIRGRLPMLIAAITVLALATALLFSPVQAQQGSAPAKPTGLTATATHDQVVLTWDDPGDDSITGYMILRRVRVNDVGGKFSELVPDTGSAATGYTDDTVVAGTTYTYRIKAINEHSVSERSRWFHIDIPEAPEPEEEEQDAERPGKPTGLTATATHDQVVLTWDGPGDDSITGYVILRRVRVNDVGGEFGVLVPDTGSAATTYTDDTVIAGTTYTYRIKAINEHGVSERSHWFHIDIPEAPEPEEEEQDAERPGKPTGLTATATHDQVVLTWDGPGDDSITGYVILRRVRENDVGGEFSELVPDTGSAATTYTDDTVVAGTTYTYRIKAINEHGVSERSHWFHIETPAAPEPVSNSPATGAPAISGIAQVGETLTAGTAGIADADGLTTAAYTYQWKADDTDIAGATGSTYTLAADDEGKAIKVLVSFIDDAGNDEALTSAATDAVAAAQPTEPPAKPTGLTAEAGHDQVVLSWDDPGDDSVTGYMILRRLRYDDPSGHFDELVADTGTAATTYTDGTVKANTHYTYRIKAINAAGMSERSRWLHLETPKASRLRSAYFDGHNAGVHDLAELFGDTDPLSQDEEGAEEEDEGKAGNGGKPVGGKPGKNIGLRATVNICDRTPEVVDALLDAIKDNGHASVTCSTVTDAQLAEVFEIVVDGYSSDKIVPSDFAGLTGLEELLIRGSLQLTTVQASAFSELSASSRFGSLLLGGNRIKTVHRDAFAGLSLSDIYWDPPRISLGGNVIEALPLGVFDDVTGLESIDLSSNHISGFEEGFFANLPDLEELSLTGNDIKFIPTGMFKGPTALTYLGLSHNALTAVEADYFADLSNLEDLGLAYNDISSLHADSFSGLTSLEKLDLQRNVIPELPTGLFSDLNSLTELRITTNDIESLDSKTFKGTPNLEMLYLNGNYLVSLPEDVFKGLDGLQRLSLDYNYLTGLPADIFDPLDDSLTRLDLNNNNFGTLPEDVFDGLTSLNTLLMHRAGLTALPANLFQPLDDSLLYLYLDGNRLTALDEDLFDGLTRLQRLYLNGNRLTALPSGIFEDPGPSLRYLLLSDNNFSSLPANIFDGLVGLQVLFLHRSGLDELDPNLFQPLGSSLYYLYLFGNDISSLDENIFNGLTGLNRLYLQGNDLTSLPENVFDGLRGLSRLYLDGNDLTELHENIFDDLSSLGDLNLDENLLTALPVNAFEGLDNSLTDLYLRDNFLTALPSGVFAGLTGLQRLDLSCNALAALDLNDFDPFAGTLKYLDLDANNFSTPPTETAVRAKLMALESLYLNGTRPCLPAFDVGLSELSISNGTLIPAFVPPGRFIQYDAHVDHDVSTLTITTEPRNPNAVIAEPPASHGNWSYDDDDDTPGLQVELGPRGGSARWQVIAENGISSTDIYSTDYYSVVAFREHPPGSLARLRSLELGGLVHWPRFRGTIYRYDAIAQQDADQTGVTVRATTIDPDAKVAIKLDGRTLVQSAKTAEATMTPADDSVIKVKVTAEDGKTTKTYTVTFVERLDEAADRTTRAVVELETVSRYESSVEDPALQYEPLYDKEGDQIGVTQIDPVLKTWLLGRYEGEIDYPGDVDWIRLELSTDHVYEVRVDRRASGTGGALKPRFVTNNNTSDYGKEAVAAYGETEGDGVSIVADDGNGDTFDLDEFLIAPGRLGFDNDGTVWVAVRGGDGKTLVCPSPSPCDLNEEGVGAYKPHIEVGSYTVRVRELDAPRSITGCRTYRGVAGLGASLSAGINPQKPNSKQGRLNWPRDGDCHAFSIPDASRDYRIRMLGSATDDGSLPDPKILGVYFNGAMLSNSSDDDGGYHRNSEVVIDPTAQGTYQIRVAAPCLSRPNGELLAQCYQNVGTYRLEIGPVD